MAAVLLARWTVTEAVDADGVAGFAATGPDGSTWFPSRVGAEAFAREAVKASAGGAWAAWGFEPSFGGAL